jgi:hypothetical protein
MQKPRLVYYNDAHHFHGKRIEPPASIHKLQQPVDEVLGTGVDLLVLGLGYSDVYFHQSKVGRVIGQMKEVWENYIDWRIMRMVEEAAKLGTDQVREVTKRGREMGLKVFPSLKMNDSSPPGSDRCGLLKWEHELDVCTGDPGRSQWCYDYANELVRDYKLAVLREMLEDYEADGLELDFKFESTYFKQDEIEKNTPLMSRYIAQVRELAKEVGEKQGREVPIMVRVDLQRDENLKMGLDVETWLKEGSVDYVAGQEPENLTDTEKKPQWLPDAANAAGGAAYYRPPRRVYDERVALPHIEMHRALRQTLDWQGYAGFYDGYLPWPFATREHQMLRELAYPEAHARKDKRYLLQPREGVLGEETTTPNRVLPVQLVEGETHSVDIHVADDLESAKKDQEMRKPGLTLRFSFFCIEDDIEFRFNGRVLPWEDAEINDERALRIKVDLAGGMSAQAPLGMSAHWFRYRLELDDLKRGANTLEIECKEFAKKAGFIRSLNGMEVQTRYKDFVRPEGLEVDRVDPGGG